MLVGKTKGLGLDIPQALFFFSFSFFRSWLDSPAHCCQACLYARLRKYLSHKGSSTVEISPCIFVCVCAVSSSSCLHNFRVFCVIVVRKVPWVTPTFCLDVHTVLTCQSTSHGGALSWHQSSLEIPVLQGGGKRQKRDGKGWADCVCTCPHSKLFFLLNA